MGVIDNTGNVYGITNVEILGPDGRPKTTGGGGGGSPTGPAGGDLTGTYPNPGVNWSLGSPVYDLLYYPLSTNPAGYLTSASLSSYLTIASAALTYYPLTNPSGYISGITSGDVTTALGFTPYSNTNPSGFITSAALTGYLTSATAALTYYPIPTGTISQYLRGDGSLATFPTIPSVTPAALTKTDDTNVTLTLGGTPASALLQAVSLTLGWSGTLADSRIASAATWNAKQNALGYTPVPDTRNLTINSTTYDLTADRTWTIPTFNTPLTTKGDIYVRNSSVDTRLPVGLDTQMLVADSSTTTGLKWTAQPAATPTGYYGAWQDDFTQTAAASNTGYAMIFRTVDLANGVSVVTNGTNLTRITFANTGIYNLQFSSQFQNADNAQHDVTIWLRLNGTDVNGSSGLISVPARKSAGAGNEGHVIAGWNYVLSVVAGQYYELVWSTSNFTNVTMQFYAAGSPPPSAASVIMTVTQQSGIMAGTGLTAINSLTGAVQTLTTGTTGTDFAIVDSGVDHKFNLPTASATNRGALSSTDWSTFNGKQAALGYTPVPDSRTLTINGTTYDLTANRSWTVSTIPPSVNLFNYYNFI